MPTQIHQVSPPRPTESDDFAALVQRAAVQIGSLRRTLEEAAETDRLVRERAGEMGRRLEQGERFNAEMDRRLEAAGSAVAILEKTNASLHALEGLIARVQSARERWESEWTQRLDGERAEFESRLNAHIREIDSRQAAHAQRIESAMAALDRNAAAAQARAAVAIDQAEERTAELERKAADLATPIVDEFENLFHRAQTLVGDAKTGAAGSLKSMIAGAERAVTDGNDAAARLNALIENSRPAREAVETATAAAAERAALLDRCMNQATDQAHALVTIVKDVMPVLERAEGKRPLRAAA